MNTLLNLVGGLWPYIALAGGALLGLWGYGRSQKKAGRAEQLAKQREAEIAARHTADQVDNDVGIMTPDQRRAELKKWSNHR